MNREFDEIAILLCVESCQIKLLQKNSEVKGFSLEAL